jgi:hypothetical protein
MVNGKPFLASLITAMNNMDKDRHVNGNYVVRGRMKNKYSQNT